MPSKLIEQLTVPGLPTAGVVHTGTGSAVPRLLRRFNETKVTPVGSGSVKRRAPAVLGPLLANVMLYVMFEPIATGPAGPVFVTDKSVAPPINVTAVEGEKTLYEYAGQVMPDEAP
jgi:hypothetical protein